MRKNARQIVIAAVVVLSLVGCRGTTETTDQPDPTLTGIEVTTPPTKTVYVIGEEFDPAGMVVTASYDDDSSREVQHAALEITGFDSSSAGTRTVAVSYQGHTATVDVTVVDSYPVLTGIAVTTMPTKRMYAPDEEFDPTGMVVTATYSDGSTEVIPPDELTVTDPVEENVRLGSRLVTIAYRGMETTLLVAVDDTVAVAGGTFELGRNFGVGAGTPSNPHMTPVSNVTLTTFRMARHLVTQDEWRAVMTGNTNDISVSPSRFSSDPAAGETQGRRPVEEVSWYDVIVYANRLSISAGLTPAYEMQTAADASIWSTDTGTWGNVPTSSDPRWDAVRMVTGSTGYRLPTEAQWEFAAKGGNDPGDYAFSGSDNPFEVAWGSANSASMTREVGRLLPNTLGIYDMSGNVWEWVWDWWDDYTSDDKTDPTGASSGSARVLRGGSWSSSPASTRSVDRRNIAPSNLYGNVGFRLARPQV